MAGEFKVLTDTKGPQTPNAVARSIGADLERVAASAITATDDWHGKMIVFTGECTVTIPAGLRSDFSCGWSQDGAGTVTFEAGSGATVQSVNSALQSSAQYALGGIVAFSANVYRLFGDLA